MFKLFIINGPMGGHTFDIEKKVMSIGRGPENDIHIKDNSISKKHAKLYKRGDSVYIKDLKSRNGIVVDGWPIKAGERFEIKEGSHIAIGDTFMSLGEPYQVEGMVTQYSMDLNNTSDIRLKNPLYKDRRITDRKKLEMIHDVSTLLMQSLNIREIAGKIMVSLFAGLPRIDGGAIILIDDNSSKAKVVIDKSRNNNKGRKANYSRTIVNRVIRGRQAVMMSDIGEEDQENLSNSMDVMQLKSIICVPLISKEKIRGVIYVHSVSVAQMFQKEDLFLLTGLSSSAALAIENALLYTKSTLAERAVRESEKKYRILVDNANDALFITQDNVIKFPNPKAVKMLGYSASELANVPLEDLLHSEDRYLVIQNQKKRLEGKKVPNPPSFRIIRKSGKELWGQIDAVPITWEGRPAALNFLRDITQEREMEARLIQAQKMEAMGTLAGGIAHDFNNILSAIIGYAELTALDIPEGTKARRNLDEVVKGGQRAKDLVHEILTFSRQKDPQKKLVFIGPVVKEVLGLLKSVLPRTVEVRHNLEKDVGPIEADSSQIHQLIMNLCTNASHAMRKGGGILGITLKYIDLTPPGASPGNGGNGASFVKLIVSDTGHGMDKALVSRIFDPYFTTKKKGEGTGLGLSVVHGIVKSHGGAIKVKSEPDKGTTFEVLFPVINNEKIPGSKMKDEPIAKGHERILFVDDEPTLADMGKQMLERLGYNVDSQTSSAAALKLFQKKADQFDLIITDMTMPQLTGARLAQMMLKIRPNIPIVLCTGYSDSITEEKAKQIGIAEFVYKPLLLHDLAEVTRKSLGKK